MPSGVTASFGETTIDVPPGVSNFRDVPLNLAALKATTPGSYPFTVTATSTGDLDRDELQPLLRSSSRQAVSRYVIQNPRGRPAASFQATVTNTGTTTDTYNLALAGPAALVSSLGTNQVTLAPGVLRSCRSPPARSTSPCRGA